MLAERLAIRSSIAAVTVAIVVMRWESEVKVVR